VFKSDPGTNQY